MFVNNYLILIDVLYVKFKNHGDYSYAGFNNKQNMDKNSYEILLLQYCNQFQMNSRLCGYLKAVFIIAVMLSFVWVFVTDAKLYIFRYIVCLLVFRLVSISIHEISHFFAFVIFKIKVTDLIISVLRINNTNNKYKISIENNRLFSAKCTWIYNSSIPSYKYIIALCAGSISNLLICLIGIIFLVKGFFSMELLLLLLLCFYNFAYNLLRPDSTDRELIRMIKNK